MKRLSVIIPGYNTRNDWWIRCVESVLKAIGPDDQIVCIDDGSKVRPDFLREKYAADPRIVVVYHDVNKGLPTARNTGLDKSVGFRYVTFIDSDDEIKNETYERSIKAIEKTGADVAVFGLNSLFIGNGFQVHDIPDDKYYGELTPRDVGELVKRRLFYYSWNKVFRLAFFHEHGMRFYPEGVPQEDAIFNVGLVVNKAKWVTIAFEGYVYYRYDGSIVSRYQPSYMQGTRACTKAWHDYKANTPGAYEALAARGLGWYDETPEDEIRRRQWTNIWRVNTPYSLRARWQYARGNADVLGKHTFFVFLKQAVVMWLRRYCYFRPLRSWHQKRFLKRIGAKVESL